MLIHSVLVVQFLNTVDADGHRHHFVVLVKKVLGFRTKPELSICCKADSRERRKRNLAAVALRKPVIADVLNQLGFKQRLSANKIQHNGLRILVYEIGLILLV